MERITRKDIYRELEELKEHTVLNLNDGIAYGGHRIEEEDDGTRDLSYRVSGGEFYRMLYAMNKVLHKWKERKNKNERKR